MKRGSERSPVRSGAKRSRRHRIRRCAAIGRGLLLVALPCLLVACGGDESTESTQPIEVEPSSTTTTSQPPGDASPEDLNQPTTEFGTISPDVDQQIRTLMEQGGIPSLSAGIIIDGDLRWAKNYEGPAGLGSVYVPGSIQKPITATAVLQLVERGLIDLDEDVSTYLGFPVQHPGYPDQAITTRLLLTHQAGLDHGGFNPRNHTLEAFGEEIMDITLPRPADALLADHEYFERLLASEPTAESDDVWTGVPGAFSYSNIGFDLLAYIVAQVSGRPFEQYIEENIFEPLGMDHSGYSAEDLRAFHTVPSEIVIEDSIYLDGRYVPLNERGLELQEGRSIKLPLYEDQPGSGGLRTSVPDLAGFLIAHMNQGVGSSGSRILEAGTVDLMHTSAAAASGNVNSFAMIGQGMGWTICSGGVEGHVGGQPGFSGTMMMKQIGDGAVGIVLMANIGAVYTDDEARWNWFRRWYFPIEALLLHTAEEIAAR